MGEWFVVYSVQLVEIEVVVKIDLGVEIDLVGKIDLVVVKIGFGMKFDVGIHPALGLMLVEMKWLH
ncbi:hypothetical protein OROGR_014887 [Orobanche gracilis]